MWANIVNAVLAPAAAANEHIGTTDGGGYLSNGRSGENISLDAVLEVFGPVAVMALAAVVELLAWHAVMDAWVLLPLQMVLVWRYWHWQQCHSYCLATWYLVQVATVHGGSRYGTGSSDGGICCK